MHAKIQYLDLLLRSLALCFSILPITIINDKKTTFCVASTLFFCLIYSGNCSWWSR